MEKALGKKKILMVFLFVLIVAVQLARIIYVFNQRPGLHSDEAHSYGFANGYYDPYIYRQVNDDIFLSDATYKNMNEWEPGSVLRDYLVVNKGEEFAYDSVYSNQRGDMSPPLHTMILHTICSFFPETFSWWYAFSINIAAFILVQIVLFLLVKTVTGKNWTAYLICGYYGFSFAAVNTFVFLRQYALLTLITLLLLYLLARMFQKDFQNITKECVFSVIVTSLGGLTHYYFFIFACFLAGFTCFYLLFRKRWKSLLWYALSMLLGAGIGIAAYPYCFENMLNGLHAYDGQLQWPYYWNLTACLSTVLRETIGLTWRVDRMTFAWGAILFSSAAVILLAVWFVCRKETWMIDLMSRIRMWLKNWKANCKRVILGWNPFLIFAFLSSLALIMIVAQVSYVETLGILVDRYLANVMPVMVMTLCLLLLYLGRRYFANRKIRAAVCAAVIFICMVLNQSRNTCYYMYCSDADRQPLWQMTEDSDVIIAGKYAGELTWYSYELRNVHGFFMTEKADCMAYTDRLNSYAPAENRDVYLILAEGICVMEDEKDGMHGLSDELPLYSEKGKIDEQEYLDYLQENIAWIDSIEYLHERNSFCGDLHVYQINRKKE